MAKFTPHHRKPFASDDKSVDEWYIKEHGKEHCNVADVTCGTEFTTLYVTVIITS